MPDASPPPSTDDGRIGYRSVSTLAWEVVDGLLDPQRGVIFTERQKVEDTMRDALVRLGLEPGERVATIAANAAKQMLGPNPARCICNEARAHEIVRDGFLYALGRRDSQFGDRRGGDRIAGRGRRSRLKAAICSGKASLVSKSPRKVAQEGSEKIALCDKGVRLNPHRRKDAILLMGWNPGRDSRIKIRKI